MDQLLNKRCIKRDYYDNDMNYLGNDTFVATSLCADGHLSYKRLNDDQYSYSQIRHNDKIVMIIE